MMRLTSILVWPWEVREPGVMETGDAEVGSFSVCMFKMQLHQPEVCFSSHSSERERDLDPLPFLLDYNSQNP